MSPDKAVLSEGNLKRNRHVIKFIRKQALFHLYSQCRFVLALLQRRRILIKSLQQDSIKVYYGCGNNKQKGYVNVDVRWTTSVDIIGDLQWCARNMAGRCEEVYLSHVLEHYAFPGKAMRRAPNTVLGALLDIRRMLKPDGIIRIAVPDFGAIAKLYLEGKLALFPRLVGRLCGEQDYSQNLHKCIFDNQFLSFSLKWAGFGNIQEWDPLSMQFTIDSSFDCLNGNRTSLNLMAKKR